MSCIRKDENGLEKVQKAVSRMLRDTKSLSVMYKTYKDFTFLTLQNKSWGDVITVCKTPETKHKGVRRGTEVNREGWYKTNGYKKATNNFKMEMRRLLAIWWSSVPGA